MPIDGILTSFVSGATPFLLKTAYDAIRGQTVSQLRRQIDTLIAKVVELQHESDSKDITIQILTGEITVTRAERSGLIEQLATASQERATALRLKNVELKTALTGEKNCKRTVELLTERVVVLERQLKETTTAAEFANIRATALETGADVGDIAGHTTTLPAPADSGEKARQ